MDFDLDREPLEEAGRKALELFVEIYRGLESRRVEPGEAAPRELAEAVAGALDDDGVGLLAALDEFAEVILPASMATPHPLYLGLVNSSPLPGAVLGDLLISALDNNGGAGHQNPATAVLEREVVRGFAELFGLPPESPGMVLPGGMLATLQAVVLARTRHFPAWRQEGPGSVGAKPLLYTSGAAHFSVARSAQIAGIGNDGVVAVPCTGGGAMDAAALEAHIVRDRAAGAAPFAVVATLGTTGTGAVDPLAEIADICQRHSLWLHVDACYGGGAMLLDELRPRFRGVERADSITVDPHKWFFVPIVASILLTRDAELEARTFAAGDVPYIPALAEASEVDLILRGIPSSRRASALAIWMGLRAHGWGTVRDAVRRNVCLTRLLERLLQDGGFTVMPGGELSVACARWEVEGASPADLDRLQEKIASEVVASGRAWFATFRYQAKTWLRFNIINLYTRERHVRELAELVIETARRCA